MLFGNLACFMNDSFGRRGPILLSILGMLLFAGASALAHDFWPIIVSWALVGVTYGIGVPTFNALCMETTPSGWRFRVNAVAMAVFCVASTRAADAHRGLRGARACWGWSSRARPSTEGGAFRSTASISLGAMVLSFVGDVLLMAWLLSALFQSPPGGGHARPEPRLLSPGARAAAAGAAAAAARRRARGGGEKEDAFSEGDVASQKASGFPCVLGEGLEHFSRGHGLPSLVRRPAPSPFSLPPLGSPPRRCCCRCSSRAGRPGWKVVRHLSRGLWHATLSDHFMVASTSPRHKKR
ncbi:unnamed protein product [Prorocentrum cordatum]|uniref:Major facilitator superfamily (MFS) profile domain-containing protein n=1 Tax=Prorocentrum cordatum TaxID=2364126 RepID=A0ABN9TG98_9DINO|nr:unnamed protein product [Polarella glacialis]